MSFDGGGLRSRPHDTGRSNHGHEHTSRWTACSCPWFARPVRRFAPPRRTAAFRVFVSSLLRVEACLRHRRDLAENADMSALRVVVSAMSQASFARFIWDSSRFGCCTESVHAAGWSPNQQPHATNHWRCNRSASRARSWVAGIDLYGMSAAWADVTKTSVLTQRAVPVTYKEKVLCASYRIDLIVEDTVVVEIKSVDRVLPVHEAQTLTYLALTECPVALLINFNVPLLVEGVHRLLNKTRKVAG